MSYEAWGDNDDGDQFDAARDAGWLDPTDISPAMIDVMNERDRQHNEEGFTPEIDDAQYMGRLAQAGACYAMNAGARFCNQPPSGWPFAYKAWKPKNPRRDLVMAASLIIAEIERLDRAAKKDASQ